MSSRTPIIYISAASWNQVNDGSVNDGSGQYEREYAFDNTCFWFHEPIIHLKRFESGGLEADVRPVLGRDLPHEALEGLALDEEFR